MVEQKLENDPGHNEELERLMHGYIASCHNLAMECVSKKSLREAGKILRSCEQFMNGDLP